MSELLNYFGVGGLLAVILCVSVEITPFIKINPIQWIGERFNASVKEDIANIKTDIANLKSELHENDANAARRRIIAFDDELRHDPDKKHTEEQFNQIMEDITNYNFYCDNHPNYKNHKAKSAIQKINDVYDECRNKNKFLV